MHPITVRRMNFEVPPADTFRPDYIAGQPLPSYLATAISLYVVHLEPFLVKSLRRVLDQITDPELREAADRFCRQEAQHYREHERFNETLLAHGYPGLPERMDRLKAEFDTFLAQRSQQWCAGFVEGFEAYTTQTALAALRSGGFEHPDTEPHWGLLFKWHLTEELEHRHVAYDVYRHLYGKRRFSELFRIHMCRVAQWHILGFTMDVLRLCSSADVPRHGQRFAVGPLKRALVVLGVQPLFLRSWLPWYSPHRMRVPDHLAQHSAELSALARSIS